MDELFKAAIAIEEEKKNVKKNDVEKSDVVKKSEKSPLSAALQAVTVPNVITDSKKMVRAVKATKPSPMVHNQKLSTDDLALREDWKRMDIMRRRENRAGTKLLRKMGDVRANCVYMKESVQKALQPSSHGIPITRFLKKLITDTVDGIDTPKHALSCAMLYTALMTVKAKEDALKMDKVVMTDGVMNQIKTLRELCELAERDDVVMTARKTLGL